MQSFRGECVFLHHLLANSLEFGLLLCFPLHFFLIVAVFAARRGPLVIVVQYLTAIGLNPTTAGVRAPSSIARCTSTVSVQSALSMRHSPSIFCISSRPLVYNIIWLSIASTECSPSTQSPIRRRYGLPDHLGGRLRPNGGMLYGWIARGTQGSTIVSCIWLDVDSLFMEGRAFRSNAHSRALRSKRSTRARTGSRSTTEVRQRRCKMKTAVTIRILRI